MLTERTSLVEVDKQELLKALSNTQSIVERKNVIQILSHILIEAADGQLHVAATDMDRLFSQKISAKTQEKFSVTVDAHLCYDIARKLDDRHKVTLSLSDNFINIRSGSSHFTLPILPADRFPKLDDFKYDAQFTVACAELRRLLDESKFAMAREEMRYNLNGICLSIATGTLKMAATDAHRIATSWSDKISASNDCAGIIIPQKTATELRKIIGMMDGDIEVALAENKILFKGKNFHFLSKLVDGRFPEYNENPNESGSVTIKVSPAFFAVVDRVATVVNEEFSGVEFRLNEKVLTVSATSEKIGQAEESLPVETDYEGKLEVKINAQYILDMAQLIKDEPITICFSNPPYGAIVIRKAATDNFKYLIMPLRV